MTPVEGLTLEFYSGLLSRFRAVMGLWKERLNVLAAAASFHV